ncbi:DUF2252 domain-containing protein [Reyranella sp.]|uniref:DUF2252 domain-containing protein n=1 Tax=Reyranella sp. TaxID=1929291 RepID=UPI003BAB0766
MDEIVDPRVVEAEAAGRDIATLLDFIGQRPSLKERLEAGKALRQRVPRADHARYRPAADRADPVDILEAQNRTRVAKLVPVRFARMLASPFAFLRGSAAVMAADLAPTAATGIRVQACGDMHVANFGLFGSAERNLVFAINDFDETHAGPWEWDLKRLAASAAVAARFVGGDRDAALDAARTITAAYRKHIRRYAEAGYLSVWYERIDEKAVLAAMSPKVRRRAERVMDKAREKGHMRMLDRLTEETQGEHRIIEELPLIVRETHTEEKVPIGVAINTVLRSYIDSLAYDRRQLLSRYRIVDVARKVVGVGSVGTECWIVLMMGLDGDDPLFLQVKEAPPSVLAPHVADSLPYDNQGRRVVVGQRLIQGSPDIFLGWGNTTGGTVRAVDFYVRQLADLKGGVKFLEGERETLSSLAEYWALCGWALALAHAKSGDAALIAGYCGKSEELDEAIARFAVAYDRQTGQDYEALDKARRAGRIRVATSEVVK